MAKLKRKIRNKEQFIESLERYGILCIASREDDDDLKYYFYGKRKQTKQVDVMEINIYNNNELEVTVKCDEEEVGAQTLAHVKDLLQDEGYI